MNKQQALKRFREEVLPDVIARYGKNDKPAIREAWNDWTDMLAKNGEITMKQYESWTGPFSGVNALPSGSAFSGIGLGQKTARDYFYASHRNVADATRTFVEEILPTLTCEEFEKLVRKRPAMYEKYRKLVQNTKGCR